MARQDAVFTGSVPDIYDREMGPLFFIPFAQDMARRLAGLTRGAVLETAAGTGLVTEQLARTLPEAVAITATDLNAPMLDRARTKPVLARVAMRFADAQDLPFADQCFDAVLCQFGAMFFPDKPRAYAEARRVLRPGGRFLFSLWDRVEASPAAHLALQALDEVFPCHGPWFLERTPHGHGNAEVIRRDLAAGGWGDGRIETVTLTGRATSARNAAMALCQGTPMRGEIEALGPGALERATGAAARAIAARFGEGPFEAPIQALVVEARR